MAQNANVGAATRRMIADDLIPARQGGAWLVNRGQHIRVIDVEGGQICDFVCFNGDKLTERFSQARTKANQGKFTISTGDHLYSRDNNVMLTIVEDTYCDHDLQWGMCSAWVFENVRRKYHGMVETFSVGGPLGSPPFGCYEVLQKALKPGEHPRSLQHLPNHGHPNGTASSGNRQRAQQARRLRRHGCGHGHALRRQRLPVDGKAAARPGLRILGRVATFVRRDEASCDRSIGNEARLRPAEQTVSVSRNSVVEPIADVSWREREHPNPGPARKTRQSANRGIGLEIGAPGDNHGIRLGVLPVDAELGGQRIAIGALNRHETESRESVAFDDEADPPRAKNADAIEENEPVRYVANRHRLPITSHPVYQ